MKGTHTSDDVGWFSKAELASLQWETGNRTLAHDFHCKCFQIITKTKWVRMTAKEEETPSHACFCRPEFTR